jgi:hypothetical protein
MIEKGMQPLLVPHWKLKSLLIARDNKHLSDTVKQDRAAAAMSQVALDLTSKFPVYIALDIGGKISR